MIEVDGGCEQLDLEIEELLRNYGIDANEVAAVTPATPSDCVADPENVAVTTPVSLLTDSSSTVNSRFPTPTSNATEDSDSVSTNKKSFLWLCFVRTEPSSNPTPDNNTWLDEKWRCRLCVTAKLYHRSASQAKRRDTKQFRNHLESQHADIYSLLYVNSPANPNDTTKTILERIRNASLAKNQHSTNQRIQQKLDLKPKVLSKDVQKLFQFRIMTAMICASHSDNSVLGPQSRKAEIIAMQEFFKNLFFCSV